MKSCIFNIQKFSLHDGPGIRSVVFFKGCPLTCPWCSNPESQNPNIQVLWDERKCMGCQTCDEKAEGTIRYKSNRVYIDEYKDTIDYLQLCPNSAISVEGRYMELSEILDEVMKDIAFYEESNGGVTLSGGEVLFQSKQAMELLIELKKRGIHTTIETTGFIGMDQFEKILEYVDLLLFDMKHYDPISHQKTCGVSNEQIIANMRLAVYKKIKIIARIPIIPGYNNHVEDAEKFALLLNDIGVNEVNLLPFHQFGMNKYELLGIDYTMKEVKQLYPEDLETYKNILVQAGLHCYF